MIFTLDDNNGNTLEINRGTAIRFTKFDRKYKRLAKQYTSLAGGTITYGERSHVETISLTIECDAVGYANFWNVIKGIYEYTIKYSFDDGVDLEDVTGAKYFLASEITEEKIYNADGRLWSISATFQEV
jgi:hypothetical protein